MGGIAEKEEGVSAEAAQGESTETEEEEEGMRDEGRGI